MDLAAVRQGEEAAEDVAEEEVDLVEEVGLEHPGLGSP